MIIKTIGKDRGNIFIWLALFIFSLIMPCAVQATVAPLKVEVQPQNASAWRGATGASATIIAVVTGSAGGAVWGTDTYTDDSSISTAAVHAGILDVGETGFVQITIKPGQSTYTGSIQHNITTKDYTYFSGSYSLQTYNYDTSTTLLADPGSFADWGSFSSWTSPPVLKVSLSGVSSGSIWGKGPYTCDSLLALAAVHAGKLSTAGTDVVVSVQLSAGLSSYTGNTQHGITSGSCGRYDTSFKFTDTSCAATIDKSLLLFIPSCAYEVPFIGNTSLWLELVYVFDLSEVKPLFKLTNWGINDSASSCNKSTITVTSGSAITLNLNDVTLPDGSATSSSASFILFQEVDGHPANDTYFRVQ